MGRWIRRVCVVAVGLTLAVPAISLAQTPTGDSVTGTATLAQGTYRFDAHSGPSGEEPHGTVTRLASAGSPEIAAAVICLTVDANRATIRVVVASGDPFPVEESLGFVEDHGTSGDRFIGVSNLVPGCPIDPPVGTT